MKSRLWKGRPWLSNAGCCPWPRNRCRYRTWSLSVELRKSFPTFLLAAGEPWESSCFWFPTNCSSLYYYSFPLIVYPVIFMDFINCLTLLPDRLPHGLQHLSSLCKRPEKSQILSSIHIGIHCCVTLIFTGWKHLPEVMALKSTWCFS